MVDGRVQQVEHQVEVGVRRELSGPPRGSEALPLRPLQGPAEPFPVGGRQLGIVGDLGVQRAARRLEGGGGELGDGRPRHGAEVGFEVPGVGEHDLVFLVWRAEGQDRVEDDRALRGPPPVDGRLAHPGSCRDRLDGDPGVAELDDEVPCRGQDRLAGPFAVPPGVGRLPGAHPRTGHGERDETNRPAPRGVHGPGTGPSGAPAGLAASAAQLSALTRGWSGTR